MRIDSDNLATSGQYYCVILKLETHPGRFNLDRPKLVAIEYILPAMIAGSSVSSMVGIHSTNKVSGSGSFKKAEENTT